MAKYWSEALASQNEDESLKRLFTKFNQELKSNEEDIITQLNNSQGRSIDIGGYYHPDEIMLAEAMRPSALFNDAIKSLGS